MVTTRWLPRVGYDTVVTTRCAHHVVVITERLSLPTGSDRGYHIWLSYGGYYDVDITQAINMFWLSQEWLLCSGYYGGVCHRVDISVAIARVVTTNCMASRRYLFIKKGAFSDVLEPKNGQKIENFRENFWDLCTP